MTKTLLFIFSWLLLFSQNALANELPASEIKNLAWSGKKTADGSFDLEKDLALSWIPPEMVAGKWIRLSGTTDKPEALKAWILLFEGNRSIIKPMKTHCTAFQGEARCSVLAWIPKTHAGKVRASFYSDFMPATVKQIRVEILNETAVRPSELERFNLLFSKVQEMFFRTDEVDWNDLKNRLQAALDAPANTDPLPYVFSFLARELPAGGHSYVFSTEAPGAYDSSTQLPTCKALNDQTAVLRLPQTPSSEADEADYVQRALRCFDNKKIRHWIIDLRDNKGGNAAVQIAAMAPVLGAGIQFQYLNNARRYIPVRIAKGGVYNQDVLRYKFRHQPGYLDGKLDFSVLIGANCSSACEALAIALKGKTHVRLIGEKTGAYATANEILKINDAYSMAITSGYMADKKGKLVYPDVLPDIYMSTETIDRYFKLN